MKRIMMFIDSNNFYKNAENLVGKNPKFSWAKLILGIRDLYQQIEPESNFIKAYYYSALSDRSDNPAKYDSHKKFLDAINRIPFVEVVLGYLMRKPKDDSVPIDKNNPATYKHVEKGTDVNLSNDILMNAFQQKFDIALLVAADGDFGDTLTKAQTCGIEFYLVLPLGSPASKLKSLIKPQNIIFLDEQFLIQFMF